MDWSVWIYGAEIYMSIQSNANQAALERLWSHTVGIANGALACEGTDPATGQRGREEEVPGTGIAGVWGGHYFILTAKHVVEKAEVSDLRFFVRQVGALKTQRASDITHRDGVEPVRLDDPKAVIHRCGWEDLAVVTLQPNALGPMLEFFDIATSWVDPPLDELVSGVGYPVSYGVRLEEERVGPITHKAILLSPTPFNGNVLLPPVGDELKFKFRGFDADRHYLIPFETCEGRKTPRRYQRGCRVGSIE